MKPLEVRSLLIDEGGKGYCSGHQGDVYVSVRVRGASWVVVRFNVGGMQIRRGALINLVAICRLSIDGKPIDS